MPPELRAEEFSCRIKDKDAVVGAIGIGYLRLPLRRSHSASPRSIRVPHWVGTAFPATPFT